MSTRTWPTITVLFFSPPRQEEWETLCAFAHNNFEITGIEESDDLQRARFYFSAESAKDDTLLRRFTELALELFGPNSIEIRGEHLPDQDWGREWRRYFKTLHVTDRLYVTPPWMPDLPQDAPEDARLIVIEPGQAFGTGSHETTQLCLRLIERLVVPGECLLDVGTGSGILAIGAIFCGVETVIGVEYDPVCEENFWHNAELNGVSDRVHFMLSGDPKEAMKMAAEKGLPRPTRITCNMLSERFYPLLGALRSANAPLILSGFLLTEACTVRPALEKAGFRVAESFQMEEWGAYHALPV